jgi:hypothetical protein
MTINQLDANQCTIVAGTGLTLRNRQGHSKGKCWSMGCNKPQEE